MAEEKEGLLVPIDADIVGQALRDLNGTDPREAALAALWFFRDGRGVDDKNPLTFDALCIRNGQDPERAAKAIWRRLPMLI